MSGIDVGDRVKKANQTSEETKGNLPMLQPTNRLTRTITALAVAGVLLTGGLALNFTKNWTSPSVANAQASDSRPARTITVVGEGKVRIQPDVARTNFGVEVARPSVREALDENKAVMDAVLAALQEQGIAKNDIQTTGFSIYAERFGPTGPLPDDQVNYRVSNNVAVVIRDLDTVGEVVDAAVEAGANNIYGIEFRVDDPSTLESEARQGAVDDAAAKAAELAELTGVSVGELVSISEVISSGSYYTSNFSQAVGMGGGGGATPIQPGELDLLMQLQVTYAIE
jgi:uncharacterized protein YggE